MGAFGGLIQTNKGRNLQAKAEAGAQLKFTRMGVGDGQLGGQSIPSLNKLIHETMSLPITRLKPQLPAQAIVGAVLSNQDVTTGFFFRELGIFAQDPDEGEILYAYGNAGSGAEYIPPAGTADIIEKTIDMIVTFGQVQNVSAVINSSLIFATPDDVETALEEAKQYTDTAVAGVKVPDASLTQKGIVQLSNATNGTRENVAPTEKALKAAYDRGTEGVTAAAKAIPKAIPDSRSVATKPSDYSSNVAYSFKTGSVVGLPAEQFVVIHGFKGWNDDSGGLTHEYASGGTTGGMYHRTGTSSNDSWGPWMQIIDNGAPWQKRKLTEDNGLSINISNGDANSLTAAGLYVGENIANAPVTGAGQWYYINVIAMAHGVWVKQVAINLFSNTYQMRTGSDAGGGVISWGPWTQDLFQSVANGKQAIATAISGKGVAASGSDEFAVLANKISQIKTETPSGSVYIDFSQQDYMVWANTTQRYKIADIPAGVKMISFEYVSSTIDGIYLKVEQPLSTYVSILNVVLRDANGMELEVLNESRSTYGGRYFPRFLLNLVTNKRTYSSVADNVFPRPNPNMNRFDISTTGFDRSRPMVLEIKAQNPSPNDNTMRVTHMVQGTVSYA